MTSNPHTDHITLGGLGRDDTNGLYLECMVQGGRRRYKVLVPLANIAKPTARNVNDLRIVSNPARAELQCRAQAFVACRETTFRVVTKPGWHGTNYCFPDGRWIADNRRPPFTCLPADHAKFADKFTDDGNIDDWREIDRLAVGNSLMILSIGLAFAGPVVDMLGLEAPAVQLVDARTGVGKTALAVAAGSVWGGREIGSFVENWNQTQGHFELVARSHHASLVVLDDLRTFPFKSCGMAGLDEVLMRFANGVGRGRLTDVGAQQGWLAPLLSTSNTTLDQMAARHGYAIDDALRMRLIDVPLFLGAQGAYENLHGFESHGAFSARLYELADRARGAASIYFIDRFQQLRRRNDAEVRCFLKAARERYKRVARSRPSAGERDLTRMIERFATIYASATLAARVRVLTWSPRDIMEALLTCAEAHVALGVTEAAASWCPMAPVKPLDLLRNYVRDDRHRFVDIRPGRGALDERHDHTRCPGYISEHDGTGEYFFSDAMWRQILGGDANAAKAKSDLRQSDMLNDTAGRPSTRRVIDVGENKLRVQGIAVKADFFGESAAGLQPES
jgi:hypothetical protein